MKIGQEQSIQFLNSREVQHTIADTPLVRGDLAFICAARILIEREASKLDIGCWA